MTGVSKPVPTASSATVRYVPGTDLVIGSDGFDGGWSIFCTSTRCDACMGRPCAKHMVLIQRAFKERAAAASARSAVAEEGNVVAAAEEIAASAAVTLVSAP